MFGKSRKNILVIDDDSILCEVIKERLPDHEVTVFGDIPIIGELSLERIDLIITDENLPSGLGIDFVSILRTKSKTIPIIMITAAATKDLTVSSVNLGVTRFIEKPFKFEVLNSYIAEIFSNPLKIELGEGFYFIPQQNVFLGPSNEQIVFTKIEREIISRLILFQSNSVISKIELVTHVWGGSTESNINALDTHISNIKKKISPIAHKLVNVRGNGFYWKP